MPKNNVSGEVNNSTLPAPFNSFSKLTKSQLIDLLHNNVAQPLTTEDLTNCALSVTLKWLDDVISGQFASMHELSTCLSSLEKVYKLGKHGR